MTMATFQWQQSLNTVHHVGTQCLEWSMFGSPEDLRLSLLAIPICLHCGHNRPSVSLGAPLPKPVLSLYSISADRNSVGPPHPGSSAHDVWLHVNTEVPPPIYAWLLWIGTIVTKPLPPGLHCTKRSSIPTISLLAGVPHKASP